MIKVLDKTFAVLESVALHAPQPVTPQELSDALQINRSTCSRLLKFLLDAGYVMHRSRKGGYLPGPRIAALACAAAPEQRLLAAARPVLDRIAEKIPCEVLLAKLYGDTRYVLAHKNSNPRYRIHFSALNFDDLFCTATGLVLTAQESPERQSELFRIQKGRGSEFFPEFAQLNAALRHLAEIRDHACFQCGKNGNQRIFAAPVFENGICCAALGISVPLKEYTAQLGKRITKNITEGAAAVSESLSLLCPFG